MAGALLIDAATVTIDGDDIQFGEIGAVVDLSQFAAIALSEMGPAPVNVSQLAAIALSEMVPAEIHLFQFAAIAVVSGSRRYHRLGNPIALNCWQPCTSYGMPVMKGNNDV